MKWLEVIQVRSIEGDEFVSVVKGLFRGLDRPEGLIGLKIFSHAVLKGDGCLHLLWEVEALPPQGSSLGRRLSQAFKEFGLINYNLWKEEEEK